MLGAYVNIIVLALGLKWYTNTILHMQTLQHYDNTVTIFISSSPHLHAITINL